MRIEASACFVAVLGTWAPIGTIEPARTKIGILFIGASARIVWPPARRRSVHQSNQSVPAERSLFQQIQASEAKVGFDVELEELDLSSWYAALAENHYDVVSAPYTKVGPDVLRILYDSASITPAPSGYFANLAQLDDPARDDLLQRAARTSDASERADLVEQAQKTILASRTVLPLYDQQNHFLYRSGVHGIRTTSVSTPWFGTAWLSD